MRASGPGRRPSGALADVTFLVEEAHRRGLRIIADLVMNHTSDQHPWFLESRASRDNPKADWNGWAEEDHRFADARVIFADTDTPTRPAQPRRQPATPPPAPRPHPRPPSSTHTGR